MNDMDSKSSQISNIISISARPTFSNKSFEELRCEHYQKASQLSHCPADTNEKIKHSSIPMVSQSLIRTVPELGKWNDFPFRYNSDGNDFSTPACLGEMQATPFPGLESGTQSHVLELLSNNVAQSHPGMGGGIQAPSALKTSEASQRFFKEESKFAEISGEAGKHVPVSNPFGILPSMEKLSLKSGSMGSFHPRDATQSRVSECSLQKREASFLSFGYTTPKMKLQMHPRKCLQKKYGTKSSFFDDADVIHSEIFLVPRENPRALFLDKLKCSKSAEVQLQKEADSKVLASSDGFFNSVQLESQDGASEHAINVKDENVEEHIEVLPENLQNDIVGKSQVLISDVRDVLPTFHVPGYYTEPSLEELAAKERSEPGFSSRVDSFVVGRKGYGSIKFPGKTCVIGLNLENTIQFNKGEVLVYIDESTKPPIGQGLNKPAEITLLNVTCISKETGQKLLEGVEVQKFRNKLQMLTTKQGAEFISYDAARGEWKIRVEHFG